MAPEKRPGWLPVEWIVGFSFRKNGSRDLYYISPVDKQVFRSRVRVESYLNTLEGADELRRARMRDAPRGEKRKTRGRNVETKKKVLVSGRREWGESWLPKDWIVEIKVQKMGAGRVYKCYLDPSSGSRFYSKSEVLQYLEVQKQLDPATPKKIPCMRLPDNLLSHFLYSPEGLPEGWIKETKYEKTTLNKSGFKKHVYYTDPENRYVFRTLKDAFHYAETAEVTFHYAEIAEITTAAISEDEVQCVSNSLEKESHPSISDKQPESVGDGVRRCLFSGNIAKPHGDDISEGDEHLGEQQVSSPIVCILTDGEDDAGLIRSNRPIRKRARMMVDRVSSKVSEPRKRKSAASIKYMEKKAKKNQMRIIEPQPMELVVEEEPRMSVEVEDTKTQEKAESIAVWEHPVKSHEMEEKLLNEDERALSIPEDKLSGYSSRTLVQGDDIIEPERKFSVQEDQRSRAAVQESDELVVEHVTSKVCGTVSSSCQGSMQVDGTKFCAEDIMKSESIGSMGVLKEDEKGLSFPEDMPLECENKMTVKEDILEGKSEQQQPQAAVKNSGELASELVDGIESVVSNTESNKTPCEVKSELIEEHEETAVDVLVSCDPPAAMSVTGADCFEKPETGGILGNQESTMVEAEDPKPVVDLSDSALDLPFWPDPCIEFAFKTLTGDIPILDGAYFQEQDVPLGRSSASGPVLSSGDDLLNISGLSRPKNLDQRDSSSAEERHCGLEDGSNKSLKMVDEKHGGMHV